MTRESDFLATADAAHSPCMGICDHEQIRVCRGCQRHHQEIDQWREMPPELRQEIWQRLPQDLAADGADMMRLALDRDAIARIAAMRINHGGSWWVRLGGEDFLASRYEGDFCAGGDGVHIAFDPDIAARAVLWAPVLSSVLSFGPSPVLPQKKLSLAADLEKLPLILAVAKARLARGEGMLHQKMPFGSHEVARTETWRVFRSPKGMTGIDTPLVRILTQKTFSPDASMAFYPPLPDSYGLGLILLP